MEAVSASSAGSSAIATATRMAADVQKAERREPKAEERKEAVAEAPKPVKNAEGQMTGTIVNIMA